MTQGQFFKQSLTGLNFLNFLSPRLVASQRLKNLVCPTILPIAGGRIIGFIPFPRILVQCEMQSISSRIWTRVAVSISYDDNHYTTDTSLFSLYTRVTISHRLNMMSANTSVIHWLLLTIWISNLSDKMKSEFFQVVAMSVLLDSCTIWTLKNHSKKKLHGNYTKMLCAVLNKFWNQYCIKQLLCGYLFS